MANQGRDWKFSDLWGQGNMSGDPDPLWGWLSGENATKAAGDKQQEALQKALDVITGGFNKAMDLQKPYTQNAGSDFNRQRGLVQSGYYQTPYNQSFTPQQNKPQGFSFNPSMGGASFTPQKQQGLMGYTPQGLPSMGQYAPGAWQAANQPPPTPQGPQQPQSPMTKEQAMQALYKYLQANTQGMQPPAMQGNPVTGPVQNPQTDQGMPNIPGKQFNVPQVPMFQRFPGRSSGPYG